MIAYIWPRPLLPVAIGWVIGTAWYAFTSDATLREMALPMIVSASATLNWALLLALWRANPDTVCDRCYGTGNSRPATPTRRQGR